MGMPIILIILCLFIPSISWGACSWDGNAGTVASPYDHADVQACIDDITSAMSGAVTITIPAATVDWDSYVYVNMNDVSGAGDMTNITSLTIQGAGIGSTVISDTGTDTTFNVGRLFHVSTKSGKTVRITGMTLNASSTTSASGTSGLIYINGSGTQTRIDTINFPAMKYVGISVHSENGAYGLIDSCTFTRSTAGNAVNFYGTTSGNGTTKWESLTFAPGTESAWYVENCTFTGQFSNGASDAYYGGSQTVFRYNNFHGCGVGGHGNDSSGAGSSVHTQEVYQNSFDNTCGGSACGPDISYMTDWRGGTGVFFNNNFGTGIVSPAKVENYRSRAYPTTAKGGATNTDNSATVLQDSGASFSGFNATSYIYNQTDHSYCLITSYNSTTITCSGGLSGGTNNYWATGDVYFVQYYYNADFNCDGLAPNDGNYTGQQGWPCKQQVGTTYSSGSGFATIKPIYAWGNVFGETTAGWLATQSSGDPHDSLHVVEDKTFFNCTSAANCKTVSDAVDYPTVGTNQGWTYTPYTCPHPLTSLTGSCDSSQYGMAGYNVASQIRFRTGGSNSGGSIQ
jgi:hypothetical protein